MKTKIEVTQTVNSIGEALKLRRKELKYSQKEICKKAKISQTYYSQIEGDKREPTLKLLIALFSVLKMTIEIKYIENEN